MATDIQVVTFLVGSSAKNDSLTIQEMDNNIINLKNGIQNVEDSLTGKINADIALEHSTQVTAITNEVSARIGADSDLSARINLIEDTYLKRDGSITLTGDLNAGNRKITNVAFPVNGGDAANKTYVDGARPHFSGTQSIDTNISLSVSDFPAVGNKLFYMPSTASNNLTFTIPNPTNLPIGTRISLINHSLSKFITLTCSYANGMRSTSGSLATTTFLRYGARVDLITDGTVWNHYAYIHVPSSNNMWNDGVLRLNVNGETFAGKTIYLKYASSIGYSATASEGSISVGPSTIKHTGSPVTPITHSRPNVPRSIHEQDINTGHQLFISDISTTDNTFSLASQAQPVDSSFPEGHDQREYLIIGRTHANGGARIRSYFKGSANDVGSGGFGGSGTPPGLLIEAIINDNGQIDTEPGAITLNAAGSLNGNWASKNSNDNILAVCNHASNLLVVKGDGRVISITNPAATQANQLVTKSYVDSVVAGGSGSSNLHIDVQHTDYTFWDWQLMFGGEYTILDTGFITVQSHPLTKTIYVNCVADFKMTDGSDGGSKTFIVVVNLLRNGLIVDSSTATWTQSGTYIPYGFAHTLATTLSDNTRSSSSGVSTYSIEAKAVFMKNPSELNNIHVWGSIRVNTIMFR